MSDIIENFFNLQVLKASWPFLIRGLLNTFLLAVASVPLAAGLGLMVATLAELNRGVVRWVLIVVVDFLRAFPPLVLLVLVYFGLPFIGVRLPNFWAAVVALGLNGLAYYGEIFRSGIESVGSGQWQAGRASGLSNLQIMRLIVLPQAIRNVIPPVATNTIELIKNTSIASIVTVPELLRSAEVAQGLHFNPTPLTFAALIYLVILWPLVRQLSRLERKIAF